MQLWILRILEYSIVSHVETASDKLIQYGTLAPIVENGCRMDPPNYLDRSHSTAACHRHEFPICRPPWLSTMIAA